MNGKMMTGVMATMMVAAAGQAALGFDCKMIVSPERPLMAFGEEISVDVFGAFPSNMYALASVDLVRTDTRTRRFLRRSGAAAFLV